MSIHNGQNGASIPSLMAQPSPFVCYREQKLFHRPSISSPLSDHRDLGNSARGGGGGGRRGAEEMHG